MPNITQILARIDQIKRNVAKNMGNNPLDDIGLAVTRLNEDFKQDPVNTVLGSANIGGGLLGMTKAIKLPKAPQADALETARRNAVEMLGLPENNTAMDRMKALAYKDDLSGNAYRGQHQAPTSADDAGTAMYQLNKGVYPDDIYSSRAAQYYGDGADEVRDAALVRRLQAHKGNPESQSWMYRAVPKNAPDYIQHGDWVTPEKQYAIEHGEGALGGDYKVIAARAPAKALFTDGNSLYEFGYDASQRFADGPASIPIVRSSNPSNRERSRFAAFDPARVNENNLLASRLLPFSVPGLLGAYGMDNE